MYISNKYVSDKMKAPLSMKLISPKRKMNTRND